jgi:hypothetical protein
MSTNTESKARFFAQYFGQKCYRRKLWYDDLPTIKLLSKQLIYIAVDAGVLQLTPLQKITDEHAIEVAKLMGCYSEKFINSKDFGKPNFFFNGINLEVSFFEDLYDYISAPAYQYLQSKSYALDYYCPIQNRIIAVDEQIKIGWIILKGE